MDATRLTASLNAMVERPQFSNSKALATARADGAVNWAATKSLNADFNADVDGCQSFVMNDGSICAWRAGEFRYTAQQGG